ncbi:12719_t:CDS:2 [Dentiscutata heterogama]|uniref:12719_t:CDS:1 n=1 Tax=Dentiscutata heterogama TaxID=1316150 RepID=A0ACA9KRD1_9GLOM|nr:12719_t:CDS:2 [Dentiscutata heterogama]
MALVDHYAGLFELRVFKNQYAIEFLLPTGERCRECEHDQKSREAKNERIDGHKRQDGALAKDGTTPAASPRQTNGPSDTIFFLQ